MRLLPNLRKARGPRRAAGHTLSCRFARNTGPQAEKAIARLGGDVYRHLNLSTASPCGFPRGTCPPVACQLGGASFVGCGNPKIRRFHGEPFGRGCRRAAPAGWGGYGLSGSDVTVAVLDSGIKSGGDFDGPPSGKRVIGAINFAPDTKGNVSSGDINDKLGHGTHVAGIIAGNGKRPPERSFITRIWGLPPMRISSTYAF